MKKSILLVCSLIVGLMGYSCSSDDNSTIAEEEVNLVGEWELETVDFSYINEDAHPIYQSDFCVMEYIAGYDFREDGSFIYVVAGDKFGTNNNLDIWNWEDGEDGLVIKQPNPQDTNGYVFAPKEMTNVDVRKVEDEWVLTFDAELHLESTARFTLVKKDIDKETHRPELLDEGEPKEGCHLLDR